jgi:hypothetical protein
MTIAIATITAITIMNKPNTNLIYLEPDSQPNPLISALAAHTELISLLLRS